jgi:hypothetical protein
VTSCSANSVCDDKSVHCVHETVFVCVESMCSDESEFVQCIVAFAKMEATVRDAK